MSIFGIVARRGSGGAGRRRDAAAAAAIAGTLLLLLSSLQLRLSLDVTSAHKKARQGGRKGGVLVNQINGLVDLIDQVLVVVVVVAFAVVNVAIVVVVVVNHHEGKDEGRIPIKVEPIGQAVLGMPNGGERIPGHLARRGIGRTHGFGQGTGILVVTTKQDVKLLLLLSVDIVVVVIGRGGTIVPVEPGFAGGCRMLLLPLLFGVGMTKSQHAPVKGRDEAIDRVSQGDQKERVPLWMMMIMCMRSGGGGFVVGTLVVVVSGRAGCLVAVGMANLVDRCLIRRRIRCYCRRRRRSFFPARFDAGPGMALVQVQIPNGAQPIRHGATRRLAHVQETDIIGGKIDALVRDGGDRRRGCGIRPGFGSRRIVA